MAAIRRLHSQIHGCSSYTYGRPARPTPIRFAGGVGGLGIRALSSKSRGSLSQHHAAAGDFLEPEPQPLSLPACIRILRAPTAPPRGPQTCHFAAEADNHVAPLLKSLVGSTALSGTAVRHAQLRERCGHGRDCIAKQELRWKDRIRTKRQKD